MPGILRIGVLREAVSQTGAIGFKEYETAARALKIQLQSLEVREPNPDFDGAFRTAVKGRASGLITITNPLVLRYTKRIAELAIKNGLPPMYEGSAWVEDGGLMSFSTDDLDVFRRVATYVDKILKGVKPADLPVEQPTKFELVINFDTAKQIGVTVPPNVLARADRVRPGRILIRFAVVAFCRFPADAQQPKMAPRIGYLSLKQRLPQDVLRGRKGPPKRFDTGGFSSWLVRR